MTCQRNARKFYVQQQQQQRWQWRSRRHDSQVRAALKTKVMSENRRKKIEGIKQREQLRDYKTRLQTMLVQKLISKYGDRGKSNTTKNLKIKELVKDFVKRSRNINDREIRQLELEVGPSLRSPPLVASLPPSLARLRSEPGTMRGHALCTVARSHARTHGRRRASHPRVR